MELKIWVLILFFVYLILSLIVHRFQDQTNLISRYLNGGVLNTEFQADMTPAYMGVILIVNFIILTLQFLYFAFHSIKWYYAFGVILFPFIPPFFALFVPILPYKTMLRIIKKELIKNISKSPEYVLIIEDLDKKINKKQRL